MKSASFFTARKVDQKLILFIQVTLFVLFLLTSHSGKAQATLINPDGTHTQLVNTGSNTTIQINPNGTHTLIIDHGETQTIVNPDGTHSTMLNANTDRPILFNSDGTFTQIIRDANSEIRINQDGSYSTYYKAGSDAHKTHLNKKNKPGRRINKIKKDYKR